MAEITLLCDYPNCGQLAQSFALLQSDSKTKTCPEHSLALTRKQAVLFDITCYELIHSAKDIPLYEQRRDLAQQGLAKTALWEARCERDWTEVQGKIESQEKAVLDRTRSSFLAIREKAQARYEELKRELSVHRSCFEKLKMSKETDIHAIDTALCESEHPLWGIVLGDCATAVGNLLMERCNVLPFKGELPVGVKKRGKVLKEIETFAQDLTTKGQADIAAEAVKYAKELEVPDVVSKPTRKRKAHRDTTTEENAQAVAETLMKEGVGARTSGDYATALEKLQRGKELLEQWGLGSADLLLQLGLVFAHYARREDAEREFRRGLTLHPSVELSIELNNALAEVFFQAGMWKETIEVCMHTLNTWGESAYLFELLRTLYFLANAHCWLGQNKQGLTLANHWTKKLSGDSERSRCAQLLISADMMYVKDREKQAAKLYEKGLALGEKVMSQSYLVACSKVYLGEIYLHMKKGDLAERQWSQAHDIFSTHYPRCMDFAYCLNHLGSFYDGLKKVDLAETKYQSAYNIYSEDFPESEEFGNCLVNLGVLFVGKGKAERAEELYLRACLLFSDHYPKSLSYANCLYNLAFLYQVMGRKGEAGRRLKEAWKLYKKGGAEADARMCRITLKRLSR